MNHLMAGSAQPEPAVGMGCTILHWSDREAATIVRVTDCTLHVQIDRTTRLDDNGMSECQRYSYEPDTNGTVRVFRLTKRGWREQGSRGRGAGLLIGHRQAYYDYSF